MHENMGNAFKVFCEKIPTIPGSWILTRQKKKGDTQKQGFCNPGLKATIFFLQNSSLPSISYPTNNPDYLTRKSEKMSLARSSDSDISFPIIFVTFLFYLN